MKVVSRGGEKNNSQKIGEAKRTRYRESTATYIGWKKGDCWGSGRMDGCCGVLKRDVKLWVKTGRDHPARKTEILGN